MPRPFRFGVVAAHAPSRTAWVAMARRVKEAAGMRFADLELSQTIFDLEITDGGTALSPSQERGPSQRGRSVPSRRLHIFLSSASAMVSPICRSLQDR
jgi:hypothetical protein